MVLLVLRHTLPFIITGAGEYSITLFTVRIACTISHFERGSDFHFAFIMYWLYFAVTNVENYWDTFANLCHG